MVELNQFLIVLHPLQLVMIKVLFHLQKNKNLNVTKILCLILSFAKVIVVSFNKEEEATKDELISRGVGTGGRLCCR